MAEISLYPLVTIGAFVARLLVGGVLLIAGLGKLKAHSNQFYRAILGYDLVPRAIAIILARGLPWIETLIGVLLIVGLWNRLATILAAGMLLLFSAAVIISLVRGNNNNCGCFSMLTPIQWRMVYRNIVLMGLLLPIYLLSGGKWALDTALRMPSEWNFQTSLGMITVTMVWGLLIIATLTLRHLTTENYFGDQSTTEG
jgi:uncharacterized membrane protein YphA (DoxX/SURF4 family)